MQNVINYLCSLIPSALGAFWNLLIAVVILIVGHIIIKKICRKVANRDYNGKAEQGLMRFLAFVLKISLYVLLVYTVATIVGIPTASFVALIGSAGLAIDLALAKKTVLEVISRYNKLIRPGGTSVFVSATSESSVDICFRCWAKSGDYFTERAAILEDVKFSFDAAGIEIPFNQLDVHIKNDNE
ncbi:MAG: mechanosensitive ion channel family protein [Clostridia bacterium]|nr:mechanosensitive ion channel family protein [Clostridia bacterium]